MLTEKKLSHFLDDLASDLPAPGGGGAAAVAGAMGACLISMTARLTLGKEGYEDVWSEMEQVVKNSDLLYKTLSSQVEDDAAAFNEVMAALKLPKDDETQIRIRTQVMQKAFKRAMEVPYSIAQNCMKVLEMALQIVEKANVNLISDVGVAAELAMAGLESSLLNVKINLPYIKDEELVIATRKQIETLAEEARFSKAKVLSEVNNKIG